MSHVQDLEAYRFYEEEWDNYDDLYESFEWEIPEEFNMASYVCDRWANTRGRAAVFAEDSEGKEQVLTFWQLKRAANRLANYLEAQGVERGDKVGVNSPQKPETLIAHIAAWKLGAVSVPLSTLYGTDGLRYRLDDCEAQVCIVDNSNIKTFRDIHEKLTALDTALTVDVTSPGINEVDFWDAIGPHSDEFDTKVTSPDDDALLMYTSGTTGAPKGVRHGHRLLLGNLPQFVTTTCNLDIRNTDVHWNVAEWTWIGSLFATVFPALYYGRPVLGYHSDSTFDPDETFTLIEKYGISNFFAPPTALRMMMQADPSDHDLTSLRVLLSGGEDVGQTIVDWAAETFGEAAVHEAYGQTEAHYFIGCCDRLLELKEGKIGRPLPGHEVEILDPESQEPVEPNTVGEIAIRHEGDPTCFKEYFNRPEKTRNKIRGEWLLTEDLGEMDEEGFVGFVGRKDDVIICSGYRIGPEEIEDCMASHEAVVDVGVIGVSDETRGEVPKAFVVLADGVEPSDDLIDQLQTYAKERLAQYEYPREIEFIEELPTTSTGKVRRADLKERETMA